MQNARLTNALIRFLYSLKVSQKSENLPKKLIEYRHSGMESSDGADSLIRGRMSFDSDDHTQSGD